MLADFLMVFPGLLLAVRGAVIYGLATRTTLKSRFPVRDVA